MKECFENVPSSFWWNLETFGQPGEKISVILHQRVCGIFPPGGRAGAEFRAGGARAFIGGTKNSRERVTHTTQWTADAAWALRSPEVGASEHQKLDIKRGKSAAPS